MKKRTLQKSPKYVLKKIMLVFFLFFYSIIMSIFVYMFICLFFFRLKVVIISDDETVDGYYGDVEEDGVDDTDDEKDDAVEMDVEEIFICTCGLKCT